MKLRWYQNLYTWVITLKGIKRRKIIERTIKEYMLKVGK